MRIDPRRVPQAGCGPSRIVGVRGRVRDTAHRAGRSRAGPPAERHADLRRRAAGPAATAAQWVRGHAGRARWPGVHRDTVGVPPRGVWPRQPVARTRCGTCPSSPSRTKPRSDLLRTVYAGVRRRSPLAQALVVGALLWRRCLRSSRRWVVRYLRPCALVGPRVPDAPWLLAAWDRCCTQAWCAWCWDGDGSELGVVSTLRLRTRIAYGFRSTDNLIALCLVDRGGHCPPLPAERSPHDPRISQQSHL